MRDFLVSINSTLQRIARRPEQLVDRDGWPHVVIVGGGFGGINVAKGLRDVAVRVTLVDQHNYHLFQPLLYQVATASLSPADIASPIRSVLRQYRNVSVMLGRAVDVDVDHCRLHLADGQSLDYDVLVLATGSETAYFGHTSWEQLAPGLKDIDDGVRIRRRILDTFERAERTAIAGGERRAPTFAIVGGGPTGVELAGAIGEIAQGTLSGDFRAIDPQTTRILLIDGGDRILSDFPASLSRYAERDLDRLGVEVRSGSRVTKIEPGSIAIGEEEVAADAVIWAAGVTATPIGQTLGVELDHGGRIIVKRDLTVPGHPDIYVIGDLAAAKDAQDNPLPGVAQVAIQGAEATVENIRRHLVGKNTVPFDYHDRGMLATIGRGRAIGVIRGRAFAGFPAWLIWAGVHIWSLIEFRSRLTVMLQWAWAYITHQRTARLMTGEQETRNGHA